MTGTIAYQQCINPDCAATYSADQVIFRCARCDGLLDIEYDWSSAELPGNMRFFETRWSTSGRGNRGKLDYSGVWRFRELLPFAKRANIATIGEGRTQLQQADLLAQQLDMKPGRVFLQYEGFNPSGSFKDNGMAAAFTVARQLGISRIACASTGNTSASMALYAAAASAPQNPIQAIVFIGSGKIAYGKLSQALDYGAMTLQIDGDFDDCMQRVQEVSEQLKIYLMNSVNPFRIEGQKTIMYRVLEGLDWQVPEWIIVPGGNLGNCSAFGKAWMELKKLGLVKTIPRLAVINATGANTLYSLVNKHKLQWNDGRIKQDKVEAFYKRRKGRNYKPHTLASAIEISRPVNLSKALRSLHAMNGVVREVDDETILNHKALVARYGFGCEPASAASVAGLHLLRKEQIISEDDRVVCILTGHALKDPNATVQYHSPKSEDSDHAPPKYANYPIQIPNELNSIYKILSSSDLCRIE